MRFYTDQGFGLESGRNVAFQRPTSTLTHIISVDTVCQKDTHIKELYS